MKTSSKISNGVKKKLKIAVFCTNEWPTPPPQNIFYAPLWIAYYITEGLAKKGHKVFYFGSRESKLKYAKLISLNKPAIALDKKLKVFFPELRKDVVAYKEEMMVSKIYQMDQKEKFDIIHIHPYRRCLPFAPLTTTPTVITIHDPINKEIDFDKWSAFNYYRFSQTKNIPQIYLISISNNQRKPLPNLNWAATIYNGVDLKRFKFNPSPENYFIAAGRFVPEKGIDLAILAAKKAEIKLKIAGGPAKGKYWKEKIKPFLGKDIEYVGMVPYLKMSEFYGKAKGLLAPIRWQEPFGLYFIESMACGTPAISFDKGSAREVIKDGKTGFIVKNVEEMIKAMKKIDQIKREDCRAWVEENFTIERMVSGYEKIFYKIVTR
jgi:glycosyltransferase involved in cell wall biosynthesis